jgi:hypothetical protein
MNSSCEYIQEAVTDSQQEMMLKQKFGAKHKYSHCKMKVGHERTFTRSETCRLLRTLVLNLGFIKYGILLHQLGGYQLQKKQVRTRILKCFTITKTLKFSIRIIM